MGKYFGTDGVRGIANLELTPELAFKIGRCGGYALTRQKEHPKVLIGRDTRISGQLLEGALMAGLLSIGVEVLRLGVITTPGVAYLTKAMGADAGIMISASHNPVQDNGIKFFGADGFKLGDDMEQQIESYIDLEADNLPRPTGEKVGQVMDFFEGGQKYIQYLKSTVKETFSDLHIVLDCANGAASSWAPKLFADLGAKVTTLYANPNGTNINQNCGSTHPENLREEVLSRKADIGLAFDGDADRLIAVDEKGNLIDGDHILYICGTWLKEKGKLKNQTVVSTVMSNIGFRKKMEEHGIHTVYTSVGDRYVVEEMRKNDYVLGGEQSGHIIFLQHNTTGDGMLTALQLIQVMTDKGKALSSLAKEMTKYPQKLVNVPVKEKKGWDVNPRIQEEIGKIESLLSDEGRLLVRPSGTESIIRLMAEGPDEAVITAYLDHLAQVIKEELS